MGTTNNDGCDNEILFSVECDAVHALVTEDRGIHARANARGLQDRIFTIQMAEDWLRRLHESREVVLPHIGDIPLHNLTALLGSSFFDSLRAGYPGEFDTWFRAKARDGRNAWIYRDELGSLGAICVYAIQEDERINDAGDMIDGRALKLCTFKVDEACRGRKIGELFLKAAFRFGTENACESIFLHADKEQDYLIRLLHDFGFEGRGTYKDDVVLVKEHPRLPPTMPALSSLEYSRRFFPHFRHDHSVRKFVVPIQPQYHDILFPDYHMPQKQLFDLHGSVGNAIKLAYLCHAPTKSIAAGDLLLFYRTKDLQAVTSIGVVERFETLSDAALIATMVRRRTAYSLEEIQQMALKPTRVILFRLIRHIEHPVTYDRLQSEGVVSGPIQTIRRIGDEGFSKTILSAPCGGAAVSKTKVCKPNSRGNKTS